MELPVDELQAAKDRLCEAAESMDPVVCTCSDCRELREALDAYRKLKGAE
jgi:hypothetical protein